MGIRTKVEIEPALIGLFWAPGTSYRIALEEGFVKEDGGDQQPSPAVTNLLSFTTNGTGPAIGSTNPLSGSAGNTNTTLVVNTSRRPKAGSGNIRWYEVNGGVSTLLQTWTVTSPQVSFNLTSVVVNIYEYEKKSSQNYRWEVDKEFILDYDNFELVDDLVISYTTGTPAYQVEAFPAAGSTVGFDTSVNGFKNITFSFSGPVRRGSGAIKIYDVATNELYHTWTVSDSQQVGIVGNLVTLYTTGTPSALFPTSVTNWVSLLEGGKQYKVIFDSNAIIDLTFEEPVDLFFNDHRFYTYNSTYFLSSNTTNIYNTANQSMTISFDSDAGTSWLVPTDAALAKTKGIKLYKVGSGSDTLIRTFYVNNDADAAAAAIGCSSTGKPTGFNGKEALLHAPTVPTSGNNAAATQTLTLWIGYWLENNATYYIKIDSGTFYDKKYSVSGVYNGTNLLYKGISDTTSVRFTTTPIALGELVANQSYIGNKDNQLFTSASYIQPLSNSTSQEYVFELSSTIGKFSITNLNGSEATTTLSYTGTKAQINALIPTITFWPNKGTTATGSFQVNIKKSTTTIFTDQSDLTHNYSIAGSDYNINWTFDFLLATNNYASSGRPNNNITADTASSIVSNSAFKTWTMDLVPARNYYCQMDILAIGRGGPSGGGIQGGGAGGVLELFNVPLKVPDNELIVLLPRTQANDAHITDNAQGINDGHYIGAGSGSGSVYGTSGRKFYKYPGITELNIDGYGPVTGSPGNPRGGSGAAGQGTISQTEADNLTNGGPGVLSTILGYVVGKGGSSLNGNFSYSFADESPYPYGHGGEYSGGSVSNKPGAEPLVIIKIKF
jgi:hypothetical protein